MNQRPLLLSRVKSGSPASAVTAQCSGAELWNLPLPCTEQAERFALYLTERSKNLISFPSFCAGA